MAEISASGTDGKFTVTVERNLAFDLDRDFRQTYQGIRPTGELPSISPTQAL